MFQKVPGQGDTGGGGGNLSQRTFEWVIEIISPEKISQLSTWRKGSSIDTSFLPSADEQQRKMMPLNHSRRFNGPESCSQSHDNSGKNSNSIKKKLSTMRCNDLAASASSRNSSFVYLCHVLKLFQRYKNERGNGTINLLHLLTLTASPAFHENLSRHDAIKSPRKEKQRLATFN